MISFLPASRGWLGVLMLLGSMLAPAVHAHGMWFAQRSGDLALIYGEGGDDLDPVKRLPLIRHVAAYAPDGHAVPTALVPEGKLAVADLSAAPAILTAVLDNGIWSKTGDGRWHKMAKNALSDVVHSSHNFKYAVHLLAPLTKPLAVLPEQTLQLIPLSPIPDLRGETLRLRVLFQGQPYAGAKIVADFTGDPDGPALISDSAGEVVLEVRHQGLNVIAVEIESAPRDGRLTDAVGHVATLSFRLKHAAE
jgi:nickel transport protein